MSDVERAAKADWIAYAKRGRARRANSLSPWVITCPDCEAVYVGGRTEKGNGAICPHCLLSRDLKRPRKDRPSEGTGGKVRVTMVGKPARPDAPPTCLKLARNECPNYRDGTCLGAALRSAPEVYGVKGAIAEPLVRCLLSLGLPCKFFDLSILAALPRHPSRYQPAELDFVAKTAGWQVRVRDWKRFPRKKRDDAPAMQTAVDHPFLGRLPEQMLRERQESIHICAADGCLEPRDAERTYCPDCARKRRKEATRERVRAHREEAKGKTGGM